MISSASARKCPADSARRDSLQQELREAELKLGRCKREMAANQRALAASEEELKGLQATTGRAGKARDAQQARIALELKTAWQLGQQGQVKVLLNQESPHTVARAMAYYRYFFEARNELVSRLPRDTGPTAGTGTAYRRDPRPAGGTTGHPGAAAGTAGDGPGDSRDGSGQPQ